MKQYVSFILVSLVVCLMTPLFSASAQVNVTQETIATNVTLVWEAQSYVPPFYKGKALMPDGGDVKILAFPPTDLGDASELTYTWKINGEVKQDASGLGRSFFIYESGIFGGSPLIVVEVLKDGERRGTGALRVPLATPRVILYPALPLAGILFGSQVPALEGQEITVEAYPLFFGVQSKFDPALTYRWQVSGEPAENPQGNSGRLVLRSEASATAPVSVSVHNERNLLESANARMEITFEE